MKFRDVFIGALASISAGGLWYLFCYWVDISSGSAYLLGYLIGNFSFFLGWFFSANRLENE